MRIPASRVYRALDEVTDAVLLRADERKRSHLPREAAGGGPPADPDASGG